MAAEEPPALVNPDWFVRDGERWHLKGSRCRVCGRYFFPARPLCPECLTDGSMDEVRLSGRGRLYSYTVAFVGPSGFDPPYAFGYVDLDEGIRLFTPMRIAPDANLPLGTPMRMTLGVVRRSPDGTPTIGFVFEPEVQPVEGG